jgi:predicted Zn-dependent protease
LISYFRSQSENTVTGEVQHIDLTPNQEIAMGLQAAPEMADQFGGLDPNSTAQALTDQIGSHIVSQSPAGTTPYPAG